MTKAIATRDDFVAFLQTLRSDLVERPDDWPNPDLPAFLYAVQA